MKRNCTQVFTVTFLGLFFAVGTVALAQGTPATLEATVHEIATGMELTSGGPWLWELPPWSVDAVPTDVELSLVLLARDAEANVVLRGELPSFTISSMLVGPYVALELLRTEDRILVTAGPFLDLGWVALRPDTEVIPVVVDIKPGSSVNPLNICARGVLPVALAGSDVVDAGAIDPTSFALNGVSPAHSSVEDVTGLDRNGSDGVMDLVFHFDVQSVAATLGETVHDSVVELTLEGTLPNGITAVGSDSVRIIKKDRPGRTRR